MLKFFRKYNKIILVIGGSFLMVSFLLMDSIGRLGGQLGLQAPYARVDGEKVPRGEMMTALDDLNVVRRIAPEVLALIGISQDNLSDHWFLLTYEAEKAGLVGGPGDGGAEFIETAANLVADRQVQNMAQQLAGFSGMESLLASQREQVYSMYSQQLIANRERMLMQGQPERAVDMALAKMRAVIRMLQTQPSFTTISRPRAVSYASEMFDIAFAKVGVIPANALDVTIPAPTDAEIREHFGTYKDQRPEDNELGIGYLLEPAVRVQTLSIDRSAITDSLTVDEIEVNKYWRKNQATLGADWASAKASATDAYKQQRATEILERAVRIVQRETLRTTRNLPTVDGYKELPEDWESQRVPMEMLVGLVQQELSKEFGFDMPMPTFRRVTERWLDSAALSVMSGIGNSDWRLNETVSIPFKDMMMNARAFDGNPEFGVQEGLIVGPFRSPQGVYFARIEDTRQEGEPESIGDDLREQIVRDIRAVKVYEDLKANADDFRDRLVQQGFDEAFAEIAPATTVQNVEIAQLAVATPGQTRVLDRFNSDEIRDTVMSRVRSWETLADVEKDIPLADRTFVIPLPSERSLVAIQVFARNPLTIEEFHEGTTMVRNLALQKRMDVMDARPYSLQSLIDRLDVTFFNLSGGERDLEGDVIEEDGADS